MRFPLPLLRPAIPLSRRTFSTSSPTRWSSPTPLSSLPIDISPEVLQAKDEGRAIVALESTLITHGLPPPHSLSLPIECEQILRSQGVTPATIAILGGRIKVGLTEKELAELSEKGFAARSNGGGKLWKVGRRELGAAVVKRMDGGTTVSGTMAVAHLAGIKIFSTGGIGGVHRGAETSFDISSDLISLSDTPVAVVCAGSKSILDIGLTLEYLEAHAVPVASYGTLDWPAFYTPKSGFKAPMQLDTASQVAETIVMTDLLGLPSSLLLGVPLPEEYHAAGDELQVAVDQAVAESLENGMAKSGKGVTPWLLERVGQLTKGKAIISNMALIKNNVRVGGEVALEYAKMKKDETKTSSSSFMPALPARPSSSASSSLSSSPSPPSPSPSPKASLVVIGSLAVDITMTPHGSSPHLTTAPGTVSLSLGGVAGNVSGAAHSIGIEDVLLVAPVAPLSRDVFGEMARGQMRARGMRDDGLVEVDDEGARTATCGILLDAQGDLMGGVADMGIVTKMKVEQVVEKLEAAQPRLVCFDGNVLPSLMNGVIDFCKSSDTPIFFEPTSDSHALKVFEALSSSALPAAPLESPFINFCAPNKHELAVMYARLRDSEDPRFAPGAWFDYINVPSDLLLSRLPSWVVKEGIAQMAVSLLSVVGTLFIKSGSRGVLVVQRLSGSEAVAAWKAESRGKGTVVVPSMSGPPQAIVMRHYEALPLESVGTVTGAGDNLAGAILAAVVRGLSPQDPKGLYRIVDLAQRAAVATLQSTQAVGDHRPLHKLLPASL